MSYDRVNRTYSTKPTHNHTPKHNDIQAVGKFEYIFKTELHKLNNKEKLQNETSHF